uniref:Uncharacterized protein n=1 Tax=Tanacetum cinerariifolium TaxID=118510 RepID=A0A6L2N555_TANCI|nr:hypothetical protein [Tanacetum cinerariifolium]
MRRVGKGCSMVETPLFKGMLVARKPEEQGDVEEQSNEEEHGNADTTAEEPITAVDDFIDQSIQLPTPLTLQPQQLQDIPSTSQLQSPPPQQQSLPPAPAQGAHFPMSLLQKALDAYATLARRVEHLEHDKVAQDLEILKLKSRVKKLERANKLKTVKLRRLRKESDKDEGAKVVNEQEKTEEVRDNAADAQVEGTHADIYHIDMDHAAKVLIMQEDEPEIQEAVEVVRTAKLINEVIATVSETVSAAAVVQADIPTAPVNVAAVMTTPAPVKNTVGFTLDFFKGMSYDDIRLIFEAKFNANLKFLLKSKEHIEEEESRAIALINETPAQKAEDDDVFTEATPLARKVPVMDYQIIHVDNKHRYKIICVDDTHQLYRCFIAMLKKFDREDLEILWNIVKERKLLTSCGVYMISFNTTQIIKLVERRYLLKKFTLEQMLNVVRLQVEEESEMSLELIRFTRQQLQEGQHS